LWFVLLTSLSGAGLAAPIRAFSLREANRLLEAGTPMSQELATLGGITRFAGMVFDRQTSDVILVGKLRRDLPAATLDDLVVALRCVITRKEYPVVSIDAVPDTATTRKQEVRFKGGIARSQFGADFLASDVLLKRYSLDLLEHVAEIRPYLKIYEDAAKKKIEEQGHTVDRAHWCSAAESAALLQEFLGKTATQSETVQSRFWFYNLDESSHVTEIDDVFVIDELRLGVKVEVLGGSAGDGAGQRMPPQKDQSSEQFAAEFTQHYAEACSQYHSLNRLKVLFDMLAISTGISHLGQDRPTLDYLLNKHCVQAVVTPEAYPLLSRLGEIASTQDGVSILVLLSGGVELKPLLVELEDGVPSALRQIVLRSRPDQRALSWALPLNQWDMPNNELQGAQGQDQEEDASRRNESNDLGFSLARQVHLFDKTPRLNLSGAPRFNGFPSPPPVPWPGAPLMVLKPLPRIVTGGVDMRMKVDNGSFRQDETGQLGSLREQILKSRQSPDRPN
jgi:hypothetical protein